LRRNQRAAHGYQCGTREAAALIAIGKDPCAPAVTLPGLAENPAGRFGKSMNTVPVNPVPATTCTVTGSVLFCITGAGELEVVTGRHAEIEIRLKDERCVAVAVMAPEVSRLSEPT